MQNGEAETDPLKYTYLFSDQGTKATQQMKGGLSKPTVLEQLGTQSKERTSTQETHFTQKLTHNDS